MTTDYADATDEFFNEHSPNTSSIVESAPNNENSESETKKRKTEEEPEAAKKPKIQENRAIFVSNLPPDTTKDELEETFKKYGILDKSTEGLPRIKMYEDDQGKFTGEALIVYFRKDSIKLAIQMMDDYFFRIEDQSAGRIRVKEADMSYKRNKEGDEIAKKLSRQDKKASQRNRADLNRKLAEWSDNEEEVAEKYAPKKNKWAKVVVLKHTFTLEELAEDAANYLEIKDDIREEAERFGTITNVTLYDKEADGICTVRFREFEDAEKFCKHANGKPFAYRKLEAWLAQDKPKFKKSAREEEPDSE